MYHTPGSYFYNSSPVLMIWLFFHGLIYSVVCLILSYGVITGLYCFSAIQNWANSLGVPEAISLFLVLSIWFLKLLFNNFRIEVLETCFLVQLPVLLFVRLEAWKSSFFCMHQLTSLLNVFLQVSSLPLYGWMRSST